MFFVAYIHCIMGFVFLELEENISLYKKGVLFFFLQDCKKEQKKLVNKMQWSPNPNECIEWNVLEG